MCSFCLPSGDGGNDVSMIQAADAGVGIEGKVREIYKYKLVLYGWLREQAR